MTANLTSTPQGIAESCASAALLAPVAGSEQHCDENCAYCWGPETD